MYLLLFLINVSKAVKLEGLLNVVSFQFYNTYFDCKYLLTPFFVISIIFLCIIGTEIMKLIML